jgi:hypothetical protein
MSHDVVLVQTWVPIPCNVVEADLDVKDEEDLMIVVSLEIGRDHGHIRSCSCQYAPTQRLEHVRHCRHIEMEVIQSPLTALTRPAATRQTVEKNFILKVKTQGTVDPRSLSFWRVVQRWRDDSFEAARQPLYTSTASPTCPLPGSLAFCPYASLLQD